jgi:hypothetical protein
MPDGTSIDSVESVFQRIEASSKKMATKATGISQFIEIVEGRLVKLPGKTEARVSKDNISLSFSRANDWGLWLSDEETASGEADDLTRVSIMRKARALPLLIELLEELQAEQDRQLKVIDEADDLIGVALGVREKREGK